MGPVKLTALDTEDLAIISALMQDAVFRLGDIAYLKKLKKFVLVGNRFAWDDERQRQRRRAGLQFGRVISAKTANIRLGDDDAVISLLAITFLETDAPSGHIDLTFSGGGSLRLEVECIEAELNDFGPAWATANQPKHDT